MRPVLMTTTVTAVQRQLLILTSPSAEGLLFSSLVESGTKEIESEAAGRADRGSSGHSRPRRDQGQGPGPLCFAQARVQTDRRDPQACRRCRHTRDRSYRPSSPHHDRAGHAKDAFREDYAPGSGSHLEQRGRGRHLDAGQSRDSRGNTADEELIWPSLSNPTKSIGGGTGKRSLIS